MTTLCKEACEEFRILGYKKDIHPRTLKESYNISKQADGKWFKATKLGLHAHSTTSYIDFDKMPILLKLTNSIDELDPEFQKKGGRIFITESLVYKIKKGTEYPLLLNDSPVEKNESCTNRYQNVCEEFLNHGHVKDRHRVEETYIISKTPNGEWSISSNHINHSGKKKTFNLAQMPHLKRLANKINKSDPVFESNGGRVFITPTRVYRIKNKIEIDFILKTHEKSH
ncbi:MAG: hypothetical protein PHY93_00755 [Bacteriovorax sp.]|nr:hypothetical protein [Bacteriovorax sp.]